MGAVLGGSNKPTICALSFEAWAVVNAHGNDGMLPETHSRRLSDVVVIGICCPHVVKRSAHPIRSSMCALQCLEREKDFNSSNIGLPLTSGGFLYVVNVLVLKNLGYVCTHRNSLGRGEGGGGPSREGGGRG